MIALIDRLMATVPDYSGVLVTSSKNISYLTGYPGEDCVLVAAKGRALLVTDFRYAELAEAHFQGTGVEVGIYGYAEQGDAIKRFFSECHVVEVRFEEGKMTYLAYQGYAKLLAPLVLEPLSGAIEKMRAVKSEEEIACIKKAQQIAEAAFIKTLPLVKEGVTERYLAVELEHNMRLLGAEDPSFASIVASGEHSSVPHAVPDGKKIKKGELITFDFGAIYKGYCSDTTRTVALGDPGKEAREIYRIVGEAHAAGISQLKAGMSAGALDAVCRDIITAYGYGACFGHGTGHGVGLDIHEYPRLGMRSEDPLVEGMIVTVEPGIYLKGKFGVRTEDILVVRKNGAEDLTTLSAELTVL